MTFREPYGDRPFRPGAQATFPLGPAGRPAPDPGRTLVFCLLALLASFATLVPGGPIENRDFSHLSGAVYWGFNAFLVLLGVVGFATAYLAWKGRRGAYRAAIAVGWAYVVVVALDLARVFPVSPDPTGFALGLVMIADAILALYVVLLAHRLLGHLRGPGHGERSG